LRYSCCSYPTDTGNRLRFAGADTPRGAYGRLVLVYGVPVPSRNPALRARVPLIAPALCSASYAFDGLICHSGAWGEDDGLAVSGLGLPVPPHLLEDYPEEVMRRSLARVETDGLAAGGLSLPVPLHLREDCRKLKMRVGVTRVEADGFAQGGGLSLPVPVGDWLFDWIRRIPGRPVDWAASWIPPVCQATTENHDGDDHRQDKIRPTEICPVGLPCTVAVAARSMAVSLLPDSCWSYAVPVPSRNGVLRARRPRQPRRASPDCNSS